MRRGKKAQLVTQNIDGLHAEVMRRSKLMGLLVKKKEEGSEDYYFTEGVYEIHGNISYARCFEECSSGVYAAPQRAEEYTSAEDLERCPLCNALLRPHILWFDECYNEHFYRASSVETFAKTADAVLVVGTALETAMAARLVRDALRKGTLVVECNLEQVITQGKALAVIGKSEEVLPRLVGAFKGGDSKKVDPKKGSGTSKPEAPCPPRKEQKK